MVLRALALWKQQLTRQIFSRRSRLYVSKRSRQMKYTSARVEQLEQRVLLSAVTGTVFDDINGNGSQDAGEAGIAGVTVYLDANNNGTLNSGEQSVLSDTDGNYGFEGLAAGEYVIRQITPLAFEQTSPQDTNSRLFATTFFGTHRVQELDPADGTILNEFALPNPQASFTQGLAFGDGTLFYYENSAKTLYELDPETGAIRDQTSLAAEFANRNIGGLAAMNGLVYMLDSTSITAAPALVVFDPVSDQVTATFPRLLGVTVEGGLAALPGENLLVTSSTNDEFLFLDPATGQIRESTPYNATLSNSTVSGLAVVDGEIYLTAGGRITDVLARDGSFLRSFIMPVESGGLAGGTGGVGAFRVTVDGTTDVAGLDFGNRSTLGRISGVKFEDVNGNGIQDAGENGIAGVTIYLDQNRNGVLDEGETTAITGEDGSYYFTGLLDGVYTVREVVPERYIQTTVGNDPGTFYGAAYIINGNGLMNFVEIDGLTGRVERIGAPLSVRPHGLVRTNSGEFYALNGWNADSLYQLDPTTGDLTLIGATGYEMTFGLAYDSATDTIYGVGKPTASDTVNYLLEIDRTTGSVTQIGPGYEGLVATSGLAFDPVNRQVLAFDNNDKEVVAFDLDGTAEQKFVVTAGFSFGHWSLAHTQDKLIAGGLGTIGRRYLVEFDLETGERRRYLTLSEDTPLESLDWVNDPTQYRFSISWEEGLLEYTGVDFGNQRLNAAPTADAGGPYTITEGSGVTLSAAGSTDPDGDSLTYQWDLDNDGDFDDASGVTVTLDPAELAALGLGDDGVFSVSVLVSDGDLTDTATATLLVENAAPDITSVVTDADDVGDALPGQSIALTASFDDPGLLDTHTATIDWGDGTQSAGNIAGNVVTGNHTYDEGGVYLVSVSVTDDDGDTDAATTTVYVTGIRVKDGVLQIVGTRESDNISIRNHRKHGAEVRTNFLSGRGVGFDASGVTSIEAYLGNGDDKFSIDNSFTQPLLIVGGAGNDRLSAGGGRSLIIGGFGSDRLDGGRNEDLLISGTTAFDEDVTALRGLLAEWSSARTLEERVANLFDGSGSSTRANGDYFLTVGDGGTVSDDGDSDTLSGGRSTDWLFYNPDNDRVRGRVRDDLFANDLDGLLGTM